MRKLLVVFAFLVSGLFAGTLPTFGTHPWFKTYNGYPYRDADMMIATDGQFLLYPKIDKKGERDKVRVSDAQVIKVKVVVEYQAKGTKNWVERRVNANGFEVSEGAAVPRAKAEFVGTVTGGVKYRFKVEHDKDGVNISAEFVDMPDYSKAKYRLKLVSEFPDLYKLGAGDKKSDVSAKTRRDSFTIFPVHEKKAKKERYKMNDEVDVSAYGTAGIKSVELKAEPYGKNDVLWTLLDEDKGTLAFELKNDTAGAHKGFYVSTVLVDQTGESRSKGLRLEVN